MRFIRQANFIVAAGVRTSRGFLAPRRPRRHPAARRGIASLMAMLYLVIFSTLALGFYSAVTTASQLAHNDEKAMGAQAAVESGLAFLRYELSRVRVPGNTVPNQMLAEVCKDLAAQQAGGGNIGGRTIAVVDDAIHYPVGTGEFIPLDALGAGFRAEIRMADDTASPETAAWVKVKVHGRYRGTTISRAIEIYFQPVISSTKVFDYGIVTRGPIVITGGGMIGGGGDPTHGSVLSMSTSSTPISMTGNSGIGGEVYMTNKNGAVSMTSNVTIANETGSARLAHIHPGVEPPELPEVDPAVFLPYVKSVYKPNLATYRNVIIPANTNPTFSSATKIEGVMYIEYPNKVTFNGQATIHGSVVVQKGATPSTKNVINFGAGVQSYPMSSLDPNDPDFPQGLRDLTGSTLLAEGYHVELSGSSGSIGGIMLANSFELVGGSGGVIQGTFIGLGDVPMKFTGGASMARTRNTEIPRGLVFPKKFIPVPKTYSEVTAPVAEVDPSETGGWNVGGWFGGFARQSQPRVREDESIHHLVVVVPGRRVPVRAGEGGGIRGLELEHTTTVAF
jgi:hypothetical protein